MATSKLFDQSEIDQMEKALYSPSWKFPNWEDSLTKSINVFDGSHHAKVLFIVQLLGITYSCSAKVYRTMIESNISIRLALEKVYNKSNEPH